VLALQAHTRKIVPHMPCAWIPALRLRYTRIPSVPLPLQHHDGPSPSAEEKGDIYTVNVENDHRCVAHEKSSDDDAFWMQSRGVFFDGKKETC